MNTMKSKRKIPIDHTAESLKLAAYALLGIVLLAAALAWFFKQYQDAREKPLKVQVMLDNRCQVIDRAFVVVSLPKGNQAGFDENGMAVINSTTRSRVVIRSSNQFPAFKYESGAKAAAERMVMVADCGNGERVERTLDAMREQFKKP